MSDHSPRWGDLLTQGHDTLRRLVATARAASPATVNAEYRRFTEELRAHCRTVCTSLHGHHTSEDTTFFPHLAQVCPDLAPALARLRREHVVVARILHELDAATGAEDTERVRAMLDRLAAELDTHFAYEEKELVDPLNALTGPVPGA